VRRLGLRQKREMRQSASGSNRFGQWHGLFRRLDMKSHTSSPELRKTYCPVLRPLHHEMDVDRQTAVGDEAVDQPLAEAEGWREPTIRKINA
jgi:hypothetical protein